MSVAALAEAHGLRISAHCGPTLHTHPACATANVAHVEYFADHVRLEGMLFDGAIRAHGGVLEPDRSRPGLGVELKRSGAERFRQAS